MCAQAVALKDAVGNRPVKATQSEIISQLREREIPSGDWHRNLAKWTKLLRE